LAGPELPFQAPRTLIEGTSRFCNDVQTIRLCPDPDIFRYVALRGANAAQAEFQFPAHCLRMKPANRRGLPENRATRIIHIHVPMLQKIYRYGLIAFLAGNTNLLSFLVNLHSSNLKDFKNDHAPHYRHRLAPTDRLDAGRIEACGTQLAGVAA
jgi:hypothetical protein